VPTGLRERTAVGLARRRDLPVSNGMTGWATRILPVLEFAPDDVVPFSGGWCQQCQGIGLARIRVNVLRESGLRKSGSVGLKDYLGRIRGKSAPASQSSGSGSHSTRPPTADELARQKQARDAAAEYEGVLNQEFAKALEEADAGLRFPESPDDVLAYLGDLSPLGLSEDEKIVVRNWTEELVEEKGERAVWSSRLRLKLELRYLISEAGLHKRTPRS